MSFSWMDLVSFFALVRQIRFKRLIPDRDKNFKYFNARNLSVRVTQTCPIPNIIHDRSRMKEGQTVGWWTAGKQRDPGRPLLQLCAQYGEAKCANKRDKIFSLRGFAR